MKTIVYGAIAIAAAAGGFALYRFGIAPSIEPAPVETLAPPPAVANPPAEAESPIPTDLPDFTLPDRDGKPTSIRSWTGKSMIVNFWATWCGPCRREIPLLKKIQQEHGPEGFQVVGVAVDFRDDVLKYAKEMAIDYPLLIGEEGGLEAVNLFGMPSVGFPFSVFTDREGRIVMTHLGELTKEQSQVMLDAVTRVNSGELTPVRARTVVAAQLAKMKPS
ncbi:MAG: TlpA family protein disulfide reductase [Povalibacter sp.]